MGAITEIFRAFGPQYLARYPDLPLAHKKTINAIINCRSGEFGVVVYQCDGCGQQHRVNRHCPQCQYLKSRQWLDTQLERRLPGHHFMLTFHRTRTAPALLPQPSTGRLRCHVQGGKRGD